MAQFTITLSATLPGTDTESEKETMLLDVKDAEKHSVTVGTTYVLIADADNSQHGRMHVAVRNDGAESIRLRLQADSSATDYVILTVPAGQLAFIPPRIIESGTGSSSPYIVKNIYARALTTTCAITVLSMYG